MNGTLPISSQAQIEPPKLTSPSLTPASFRKSNFYPNRAVPDDPFLDDIESDAGRRRKRTKFARASGAWRLLDDGHGVTESLPSSPLVAAVAAHESRPERLEDALPHGLEPIPAEPVRDATTTARDLLAAPLLPDEGQELGRAASVTAVAHVETASLDGMNRNEKDDKDKLASAMGPPLNPVRSQSGMPLELPIVEAMEKDELQTTPRLHPLGSPGLPLISALIKRGGVEIGYFPDMTEQPSELDAISHPTPEIEADDLDVVSEIRSVEAVMMDNGEHGPEHNEAGPDAHDVQMETQHDVSEVKDGNFSEKTLVPIVTEEEHAVASGQAGGVSQSPHTSPIDAEPTISPTVLSGEALDTQDTSDDLVPSLVVEDVGLAHPVTESDQYKPAGESVAPLPAVIVGHEETVVEATVPETHHDIIAEETSPSVGSPKPGLATVELEREPSPKSTFQTLDGALSVTEDDVPELPHLLQGIDDRQDSRLLDSSPHDISSVPEVAATEHSPPTEIIAEESLPSPVATSQPIAEDPGEAKSTASHQHVPKTMPSQDQLPTPAHTQEQFGNDVTKNKEIRDYDLLIPRATQNGTDATPLELEDDTKDMPSSQKTDGHAVQLPTSATRRVSQRLSRKSEVSTAVQSPFFSKKKQSREDVVVEEDLLEPTTLQPRTSPPRRGTTPDTRDTATAAPSSPKGKHVASQVGTHTSLAYYPTLTQLHEYHGQLVDIIAACAEASTKPVKAKTGPRDWYTTTRLADTKSTSSKIPIQIFRPYKEALPEAHVGDVMILRNVKVQTAQHNWTLISTDSSAWAVFKSNVESRAMFDDVKSTGPQLEYGRGEVARVKELIRWWAEEGKAAPVLMDHDKPAQQLDQQPSSPTTIDAPTEEVPVLESVESPSSPRRSRRLRSETAVESNDPSIPDDGTKVVHVRQTTTPQPTRHQPARRARTKTPNPIPAQRINPAAATETSTLPPPSPTHTRRRTRSTLSPATSLAGAAPASASSSIAAKSPTEATFAIPNKKATGKGKGNETIRAESSDPTQSTQPVEDAQEGEDSQQVKTRRSSARASSPPLVHELRDGMRYVDPSDPEAEVPRRITRSQIHELRDGVRYVDEA